MKLNYLHDFIVATESYDMKEAAEKLGISPSVLSKHIKSIEDELAVSLFVNARKNILTEYGKILKPHAEEIIAYFNDYNENRLLGEYENNSSLKICLSPIQTRELSGKVIENFTYQNPNVNIELIELSNHLGPLKVKNGEADFAFHRERVTITRDPELSYIPLCKSQAYVYISVKNPLSKRDKLSFKDLAKETIFLRTKESTLYDVITDEFNKINKVPHLLFDEANIIYENVIKNKGVTIYLSELINTQYSNEIKIIPLDPPLVSYIDLIFKNGTLTPLKEKLIEYVFNQFLINLK